MSRIKKFIASVPGKIILSGEHSVVYGYPALLAAVDNCRLSINEKMEVFTSVPIGCGMGSSAAYSIAISAMRQKIRSGNVDPKIIERMAYDMEKEFHGNPSGADISVCIHGGYLWFRKEAENVKLFTKIQPKNNLQNLFIYNTGQPYESSKEMVVDIVGRRYQEKYQETEHIFASIETITKSFLRYLVGEETVDLRDLIIENERQLERLGVVSKSTMSFIHKIEKLGGAAKITGAGGIKESSGVILVYHPEKEKILHFFKMTNLACSEAILGGKGLIIS